MGKTKKWMNDGEQDKFVMTLIEDGKFTKNTQPKSLKREYPDMFGDFTENVIRNHINEIKRRKGLYLDGPSDDEDDEGLGLNMNRKEPFTIAFKNGSVSDASSSSFSPQSIVHTNYPYLCETYKDPENQLEMLLLAVNVPGGACNVKIDLNSEGTAVFVKYNWAKVMYNMDDLFKRAVETKNITLYHPKVISFKNGLENRRSNIDAAPESTITINLPIKVQTGVNTWTKSGATRDDGSQVVIAEFSGFVKDYNKKIADLSVVFNE